MATDRYAAGCNWIAAVPERHDKFPSGDTFAAWILAARYTEMVSGGEGGFTDGRASQEGVILLRRAYRHLTGKQMPYPLEYFTDERMRRAQ